MFLLSLFALLFSPSADSLPSAKPVRLQPSFYYTAGSYSNTTASTSYSTYITAEVHGADYYTVGFDHMPIHAKDWKYDQMTFVFGAIKSLGAWTFSGSYAHIIGDNTGLNGTPSYTDRTNILNLKAVQAMGDAGTGVSYSLFHLSGPKSLMVHQVELEYNWSPGQNFSVDLQPLCTVATDNRTLFSIMARMTVRPKPWLEFEIGTLGGRRAYYYDPDLLLVYNQDETQTGQWTIRAELSILKPFSIVGVYQLAQFEGYTITYGVVGLKVDVGW